MAKDSGKSLIILRHAHRNKPFGGLLDNGLSRKGKKQAAQAGKHFLEEYGRVKALVLSSPKRRCIETVEPIAEKIKILSKYRHCWMSKALSRPKPRLTSRGG